MPRAHREATVVWEGTLGVPALDEDAFAEVARHADEQCSISVALRGNVEVTLETSLA